MALRKEGANAFYEPSCDDDGSLFSKLAREDQTRRGGVRKDSTHLYNDNYYGSCETRADCKAKGSTQVINSMEETSLEYKSRILNRARDVAYRARLHEIAMLKRQLVDIKETTIRVMPMCSNNQKHYQQRQSLSLENKQSQLGAAKTNDVHKQPPIKYCRTRNIMRTLERLYRDRSTRQVSKEVFPVTEAVTGESDSMALAKHVIRCNEHTRYLLTTPKSSTAR